MQRNTDEIRAGAALIKTGTARTGKPTVSMPAAQHRQPTDARQNENRITHVKIPHKPPRTLS